MRHDRESRTPRMRTLLLIAATVLCSQVLLAQAANNSTKKNQQDNPASLSLAVDSARKTSDLPPAVGTESNEGGNWQGFEIKQAAEFGGRISSFTGSEAMWDTLVNLGSGPRLLEYTLDMRSPAHTGRFFDDLSLASFGYGGEPLDVTRVR